MYKIQLTKQEQRYYEECKNFDINYEYQKRIDALNFAQQLTLSLINRSAIPDNRIKYFTNEEYQTGRFNKSRKEVFESNGITGTDIYKHAHFLNYLDYFINGANVEQELSEFSSKAIEDKTYQDDARDKIVDFIHRNNLRPSEKSDRKKFADELFKLATDLGFQPHYCHDLRKEFM